MITKTTYEAHLLGGSAPIALGAPTGQVDLDSSRSPHVTANLTIPVPAFSSYAALDPRISPAPRVRITATEQFPVPLTPRVFDLTVRSRVRNTDGTVSLELASNEALLEDHAPLQEDIDPLGMSISLRAVVTHVLAAAGATGAGLATGPDANVRPVYPVINRVINTRADDTYGYALGTNAKDLGIGTASPLFGTGYIRWTSVAAGASNILIWIDNNVRPFQWVSGTVSFRNGTAGRKMRLMLRWIDSEGGTIREEFTETTPGTGTTWDTIEIHAQAPAGTARLSYIASGIATAADQTFALDFPALNDGDIAERFHPDTEPSTDYDYRAAGIPNRSVTERLLANGGASRRPEALIWQPGQTALDFLMPLVQSVGLRLVCDEEQVWTLRPASYAAPGSLTLTEGVNVNDGSVATGLEDWWDAQVTIYDWTDLDGNSRQDVDAYAFVPNPRRVNVVRINARPTGNGRSRMAVDRALGRGATFSIRTRPNWAAYPEQAVSLNLAGLADLAGPGVSRSITFDITSDRMTVTGIRDDS